MFNLPAGQRHSGCPRAQIFQTMKKFMFVASVALGVAALAGCSKEETKTEPVTEPEFTGSEVLETVPFTGGTVTYEFETNRAWKVTKTGATQASTEPYEPEIDPISGNAGKNEIKITFPANKTQQEIKFSFTITLDKSATTKSVDASKAYTHTVEVTIAAPSVTDAAGNVYKVIYLKDGNFWMAENLRYVPKGQKISGAPEPSTGSDTKSDNESDKVWYPYSTDGKETKALTDEASIKKLGLLYSAAFALGVNEIDESNYNKLEKAQGICPKGWHIPSRTELVGLCAATTKGDGETAAPAINENAVFYDADLENATVAKANEAGFNFTFSGFVNNGTYSNHVIDNSVCDVEAYYGNPRLSYYLGSTGYKSTAKFQVFAMQSTFSKTLKYGKLSAAYNNLTNGVAVRCVMDQPAN